MLNHCKAAVCSGAPRARHSQWPVCACAERQHGEVRTHPWRIAFVAHWPSSLQTKVPSPSASQRPRWRTPAAPPGPRPPPPAQQRAPARPANVHVAQWPRIGGRPSNCRRWCAACLMPAVVVLLPSACRTASPHETAGRRLAHLQISLQLRLALGQLGGRLERGLQEAGRLCWAAVGQQLGSVPNKRGVAGQRLPSSVILGPF